MNLTISGHHLEVTPALRSYVTTKLDRITRHFDQVVDVKVLLTVEKQKEKEKRQRAECNIHVKGNDLFAESSHSDLYAAVDELVDKMDRQVVRHKDRLQDTTTKPPSANCTRDAPALSLAQQPPTGRFFCCLTPCSQGFREDVHNCYLDHESTRLHPALRPSARER